MAKGKWIIISLITTTAAAGCASARSFFATGGDRDAVQGPIASPFTTYYGGGGPGQSQNMILRTKKGDRAIELEIPADHGDRTDLIVPLSTAFKDTGRGPASTGETDDSGNAGIDESYKTRKPSMADREILATFPQSTFDEAGRRREVEQGLGLIPAEDPTPKTDSSYLAGVDRIKQLYRLARYEAALLETDEMIRAYQTDSRLHQMRGTLLDRIGKRDLALRSWSQALRLDPSNQTLRKFLDRKRKIASQAAASAPVEKTPIEERAPASDSAPEDTESKGGGQ